MDKLLRGVIRYRHNQRTHMISEFKEIRDNPRPSTLMYTCMDSRLLPTRITQARVGEIFVVRNAGNLVPHVRTYGDSGGEISVSTEPAAIDLAVLRGGIRHIVVCGHSDCKAMNALYGLHTQPETFDPLSPMDQWLRAQGQHSIKRLGEALDAVAKRPVRFRSRVHARFSFDAYIDPHNALVVEDKLSQVNVLQQCVNLGTHLVRHIERFDIFVHALWFDVSQGELYVFSRARKLFVKADETNVPKLLAEMDKYESAEIRKSCCEAEA